MKMGKELRWITLGIGIGIVVSAVSVYVLGPRGSTTEMNLYTGETWTRHYLLGHTWRTDAPVEEHTRWALAHVQPGPKYWPVFVCAHQRGWFGGTVEGDGFVRDIAREIYELPIAEERRIALLHEFHQDIGTVVAVKPYKTLYEMWDERLKNKY
jgi:hypothetical protein